jgi:hypothetical protein
MRRNPVSLRGLLAAKLLAAVLLAAAPIDAVLADQGLLINRVGARMD